MSELVRQVAIAISDSDNRGGGYGDAARAAIAVVLEAMREPTPEMVEAAIRSLDDVGFERRTGGSQRGKDHRVKMRIRWQAMLAAFTRTALAEDGGRGDG